jgi:hypothetical protein
MFSPPFLIKSNDHQSITKKNLESFHLYQRLLSNILLSLNYNIQFISLRCNSVLFGVLKNKLIIGKSLDFKPDLVVCG